MMTCEAARTVWCGSLWGVKEVEQYWNLWLCPDLFSADEKPELHLEDVPCSWWLMKWLPWRPSPRWSHQHRTPRKNQRERGGTAKMAGSYYEHRNTTSIYQCSTQKIWLRGLPTANGTLLQWRMHSSICCPGAKKKGSWCVTGKLNFFFAMPGSTSILLATQTTGMSGPSLSGDVPSPSIVEKCVFDSFWNSNASRLP